nr:DNA-binding transcriptional regulator DhaR [Klebsiella pneumoniae]
MGSAPTDDENGRLSRLELANGGTLFLERSSIWRRSCSRLCCR